MTRKFSSLLIVVFLLFPYVALLFYSRSVSLPALDFTAVVFGFTALQAVLSALVSCLFGILGGMGLLAIRTRPHLHRISSAVAILPNAVPSLLVILAALNLYAATRGLWGIVWVHTLLNAGLASVIVQRLFSQRIGQMAELAWVEGASKSQFLFKGALPFLASDLGRLFLFIFALCFSSFAVPLVIGGSRATTVEVLIFQEMRLSADSSSAVGLAILQTIFVLFFSWILRGSEQAHGLASVESRSPLMVWRPGILFAVSPSLIVVAGLLQNLSTGIERLSALPEFKKNFLRLLMGSLTVGVATGVLTMLTLFAIALASPQGTFRKLLLGFIAPSSVLTGFALLFLWRDTGIASFVKIAIALTLISVPAFYRMQWDGLLSALSGQIITAKTLGASSLQIFAHILLPQVLPTACFLSGLAAFWAWGDFALSAVIGEKTLTLAMAAADLMGSYRLEAATVLVWLVFIGGTVTFSLFWGVGRVFGSRFETRLR